MGGGGDAEPAPVVEKSGARVVGVGRDAVEGEEFAEVGGETRDGFGWREFGKF